MIPYYVLFGIGVGFVVILYIYDLRLAMEYVLTLGRVLVILFFLLLVGGIVGWWRLPGPLGGAVFRVHRLWEPFQQDLLEWISNLLR